MGGTRDFDGFITLGPWGGLGGNEWVYMPQGLTKKIRIRLQYKSSGITSIEFEYYCSEGKLQNSSFGSDGDWETDDVRNLYSFVISLIARTYVTAFDSGFHGRSSSFLNALGVYVIPKSPPSGPSFMTELSSSISREVMPRDIGPWGAGGGKSWDDGVFSAIKQVCVYLGELNVIYALQFKYQKANGRSVLSPIHGGTDGLEKQLINLDESDEFFTGISGFYGPVKGYNGLEAITSISFHTNKRIYGPYGEERGAGYVYFCSTPSPGKVVGFHGRTNGFLSAIGVLMEYF